MPESEARPKPAKRKTLLLGATSFLCVLAVVSAFLFPGEENEEQVHSEDASQGSASPGAGAKGKDFETQDAADRIDAFIHAHLEGENLKPNPEIRDEQFVRRIYLAIIGRIPTVEEATLFLQSGSADKHSSLIDELLANDAGSLPIITNFGRTSFAYPPALTTRFTIANGSRSRSGRICLMTNLSDNSLADMVSFSKTQRQLLP